MVEEGYISQEMAEEAANEEINFRPDTTDIRAPHFVMFVREYLAERYGEAAAAQGGFKVTTTLDLSIQDSAQEIVSETVDGLERFSVGNGAAVVTKPQTGEILAMVGSKDFFDTEGDGNVNVTIALRQPGSSIKPVNYAAGFAKGLITPATVIMDVPTTFANIPTPYRPVNYDGTFHGPVQVRYALANSYNIPAVKVLGIVGVGEMIKMARDMGITTFEDESRYGLSLTLGGGEVKMTELATAYGVFANEGLKVDLVPVLKIEDSEGEILEEYRPRAGKRVLSPEVAFLISSILSDNGARTAAFGSNSLLNVSGKTVAVKTGTTDDKRDNWAVGYTPSFLVAAWVGNNDNSPMQRVASGITGATPIWHDIMADVLKDKVNESFKVPSGVTTKETCSLTGGLRSDGCNNRFEYFIVGTEPTEDTFARAKVWVDRETGEVVPAGSPNAEEKEEVIISDPYSKKDFCATCPRAEASPPPEG